MIAGKYSALGLNVLSSLLQGTGLQVNQQVLEYLGKGYNAVTFTHDTLAGAFGESDTVTIAGVTPSIYNSVCVVYDGTLTKTTVLYPNNITLYAAYSSGGTINGYNITGAELSCKHGTLVKNTVLNNLTHAMLLAYQKLGTDISDITFNNLLTFAKTAGCPALGNNAPDTYTLDFDNEIGRDGFLALLSNMLTDEFYHNNGTIGDFCSNFSSCYSFKQKTNQVIVSLNNSTTHLAGIYSNMNDLITNDITGVNLATLYWGQDLIRSGRAINLQSIDEFGRPSVLLKTLQANNAVTRPIGIALLASGLTSSELGIILTNVEKPTPEQEKQIYNAFTAIQGPDLTDIKTLLNVQTLGLTNLAELLDPKKLFPNSYTSLTVPQYNSSPKATNSKTYYLIYSNSGVNSMIARKFSSYLAGILPTDLSISCGAFSYSMQQIKYISQMNIEKFAQVVTNLESTKNLTVNGTNIPVDKSAATTALSTIALGSGENGTYRMVDFFGVISGLVIAYDFQGLFKLLNQLATQGSALGSIYTQMKDLLQDPNQLSYDAPLQLLIDDASSELASIIASHAPLVSRINTIYNNIGTQLVAETLARQQAVQSLEGANTPISQVYSFIDSMKTYAIDSLAGESSQILESLSDTTTGGQSIIALMREIRNNERLGFTGAKLESTVDNKLPITQVNTLNVGVRGMAPVTRVTGASNVPGNLAGSSATNLIPPALDIFNMSLSSAVLTPNQAVDEVIRCNCDCWDV